MCGIAGIWNLESGSPDEILANHFSGKINEQRRLWALISLEVSYQMFFGSDAYEPEVS